MQRLEFLKAAFCGLDGIQKQLLIGSAVAAGGILMHAVYKRGEVKSIPLGEGWWGAGKKPLTEDDHIYSFKVQTSEEEIEDLHERIDRTRYTDPLEDSCFQYGFNSTYLKTVVSYWRQTFDWKKQVGVLNQYPHFKTKIEGLDVHYVHVRPAHRANQKVLPLMLVHGWPGSFYEFYKILPLLTENQDGLVFEVICPSIPGYGYSDAPHKQGFDSLAAARIFLTLMERLGFSQFYLQGGDWGSLITTNMAQMKPLREDVRRLFPFFEKNVWNILRETGYFHIQATKPDTAGCGPNDSPVGLAAYILEKFSTWTELSNTDLVDGGLERKFSLDDVLTNVMIYWTTGSIVSSMRFYKENFKSNLDKRVDAKMGVFVPTGLAAFPGELMHCPRSWAQTKYRNIYSYTFMPRGGHFAAFEEPQLLANDLVQFVKNVEKV
ncbi:epoxide hydrolase 1 isoform X2 [Pseudoliparis swirei]|uniref:epoxide hydrolase 1 isoform X2 n=1 Tax=Pseudoliparis swirei TaxID=2059687 RepID=UPI0024BE1182|nr:epoxide hydrolase 1 isoform X2 [Pseudoliparis swirei]